MAQLPRRRHHLGRTAGNESRQGRHLWLLLLFGQGIVREKLEVHRSSAKKRDLDQVFNFLLVSHFSRLAAASPLASLLLAVSDWVSGDMTRDSPEADLLSTNQFCVCSSEILSLAVLTSLNL